MIIYAEGRRRLLWRIGRNLYCRARNEVVANNIATNGETYVQACVLQGVSRSANRPLTVFDVGANLGEWTRQLLAQLPQERVSESRIFLFEPIARTRERLAQNIGEMTNAPIAEIFPLALSNEGGEAEMVVLSETGGTNTLEFDHHIASGAHRHVQIPKKYADAQRCTRKRAQG